MIGYVSDGDGALVALTVAAKLLDMRMKGDFLPGDVFISTHICPDAPTQPHKPVPFMGSPVEMAQVNRAEVTPDLDAVLSVDTTKGNRVINTRGFAISPTVKEGYIPQTSEDLLEVMQRTTGRLPYVFPLTVQDITPYGNGLYHHLNSILQPSTATNAPVVGVAITTEPPFPAAARAQPLYDVEEAARFMLEVAKAYGRGEVSFYDEGGVCPDTEAVRHDEPHSDAGPGGLSHARDEDRRDNRGAVAAHGCDGGYCPYFGEDRAYRARRAGRADA